MVYTPGGQHVAEDVDLTDEQFIKKHYGLYQLSSGPLLPRWFLRDLKAKALDGFNCMQMCKKGARVSLDIGTFTDAAYLAFSKLLIDYGWIGWLPVVRESKRRMFLQKFVKRCKTSREE